MSFKPSRKRTLLAGLLVTFIIFLGYFAYIEINNNTSPSPTPTEKPTNSSSIPLVTDYSITIPEIYKVNSDVGLGFGIAEINLEFIAPSPLQNTQTQANFSTTKLPIILSRNPSSATISTLPPVVNGTVIAIKVDVYQYTMSTDNPRILVASQEWNETKHIYI